MNRQPLPAPELIVSDWLNTPAPITLAEQRGKAVVIEAFQMLCPGCVSQGIPQAKRIAETFSADDVLVIGLHSVFEHHEAQGTRVALKAFLHEYQIHFPVAIDAPSANDRIPKTMAAYQLRGTPSLILIDREGQLRSQHFGSVSDLTLGAQIMQLVGEAGTRLSATASKEHGKMTQETEGCDEQSCPIDQS